MDRSRARLHQLPPCQPQAACGTSAEQAQRSTHGIQASDMMMMSTPNVLRWGQVADNVGAAVATCSSLPTGSSRRANQTHVMKNAMMKPRTLKKVKMGSRPERATKMPVKRSRMEKSTPQLQEQEAEAMVDVWRGGRRALFDVQTA